MDDKKVIPDSQELQKRTYPDLRIFISEGKQDNDGIEGDANFNPYYDDVDWCEWKRYSLIAQYQGIFLLILMSNLLLNFLT